MGLEIVGGKEKTEARLREIHRALANGEDPWDYSKTFDEFGGEEDREHMRYVARLMLAGNLFFQASAVLGLVPAGLVQQEGGKADASKE